MVPTEKLLPEDTEGSKVAISQLSSEVGSSQVTTASHSPGVFSTWMLAGPESIVGTWSSITVTSKDWPVTFPLTSVTTTETVVIPTGKVSPELCEFTTDSTPQSSSIVGGSQVTTASHRPAIAEISMLSGSPTIVGGIRSVSTSQTSGTRFSLQSMAPSATSHSSGFEFKSQSPL